MTDPSQPPVEFAVVSVAEQVGVGDLHKIADENGRANVTAGWIGGESARWRVRLPVFVVAPAGDGLVGADRARKTDAGCDGGVGACRRC